MTSEFKKIKDNNDTRYVLETATSGATSAGVVATAPGKRREDNILAQEANKKKEATKPRNFVAKNAKMGGAGQHKDKKKAVKQGAVKHKKPLAESYAEDLAKQVFDANPNIKDENAVLDAAWPIAVKDLGNKRAMSVFNYDEDFPSDLVSVYGWLQKDQQGVAEGLPQTLRKIVPGYAKREIDKKMDAGKFGKTDADKDANFQRYKKIQDKIKEQGMAEGFNGEYDDEAGMAHTNLLTSARAVMGLLKTIEDKDNLPEWVQEKIAKAEMMLVGVWDYLQSQKEQGIDPQQDANEAYGRYDRRDAYQRDYDSSVSGMDRGNNHRDDERHDLDPTDWYIVKDGKMFKTSVYPNQEKEAMARGYSRSREEAKAKADNVAEVAPPGWEKTVKAMKKHDNIDNPFALAWSMKNKGYKSHKKESVDPYFESLRAKVEELAKK
jgi:hypothetical protein